MGHIRKKLSHKGIIFTKFHEDRTKIMNLLSIGNIHSVCRFFVHNAQRLTSIGNPGSLILPKIWFFKHFIVVINTKTNDKASSSKVSMAQSVRALIEFSSIKCNEDSNPTWVFWFFFKFSQTLRVNSGFQGKIGN